MELKIDNVTKSFKDVMAVQNISYTMNTGVYGLLGVNGAGKTTLMRMLCTLLKPTNGQIMCNGKDIFKMGGNYRNILGYLPQDFGYYPDFTAEDYLMYIASIKGIRPIVAKKRVTELLHKVALEKVRRKKVKTFSGGMKRRLGIAQAMLNDPKILVLDEPTAGLDPNERIRFRNLLSEMSEDRLVLLSTHIVSDVEHIANQIILMKDGMMQCTGTSQELISKLPIKVWNCVVNKDEVDLATKKYKVANMKSTSNGIELRLLSEKKPFGNSNEENMTLEDVFLYYFGEKVGTEDVVL